MVKTIIAYCLWKNYRIETHWNADRGSSQPCLPSFVSSNKTTFSSGASINSSQLSIQVSSNFLTSQGAFATCATGNSSQIDTLVCSQKVIIRDPLATLVDRENRFQNVNFCVLCTGKSDIQRIVSASKR